MAIGKTLINNPIISKEILIKFRHKRFFWIITAYALLTFLIAFFSFKGSSFTNSAGMVKLDRMARFARDTFEFLSYWQFAIVGIITVSFTSASITSEQEQSTLQLLFSSQLDAKMIIFGKFYTAVFYNILIVLILLPIISVLFSLGGIELHEILMSYLIIIICTSIFAALSLFWSTLFKKTVLANIVSYFSGMALIIGPIILPPVIMELMFSRRLRASYDDFWLILQHINPVFPLYLLFEGDKVLMKTAFKKYNPVTLMIISNLVIMLATLLILLLAVRILKKKSQRG